MKTTTITNKFKRMFFGVWRQGSKTHICPSYPILKGKIVLITGGNRGIGLETVKGLVERQAEVIILARNKERTERIIQEVNGLVHFIKLDLSDTRTIEQAIIEIYETLKGRNIDILINNAGIAVNGGHRLSAQGYELSFSVNVLGHHILFKELQKRALLSPQVQIISVTGDIYAQAKDCTPNYTYTGRSGVQAYSRSKLGMMWWTLELHRRYSQYKVNLVHPGIVPSGLGNSEDSFLVKVLNRLFISAKLGAQMTLICATQPNIQNGAYYHNTMGKVTLPKNDLALDTMASHQFWLTLNKISAQIKARYIFR